MEIFQHANPAGSYPAASGIESQKHPVPLIFGVWSQRMSAKTSVTQMPSGPATAAIPTES